MHEKLRFIIKDCSNEVNIEPIIFKIRTIDQAIL